MNSAMSTQLHTSPLQNVVNMPTVDLYRTSATSKLLSSRLRQSS